MRSGYGAININFALSLTFHAAEHKTWLLKPKTVTTNNIPGKMTEIVGISRWPPGDKNPDKTFISGT